MPTLYGPNGQPIELAKLKSEEAGPSTSGVRSVLSGHPAQGLTPQRLAWLLREAEQGDPLRYLELAEDMEEKDTHYRSVLPTRKVQVAGLPITVDAASDAKADVDAADFLRAWLARPVLQLELFDVLDAVGKGYSLVEIIWNTSGGKWLPAELKWRDPRWFEFERIDGSTPLLRSETGPQPLSPYKYIFHVHRSKSGLPVRGGLARVCAWCYLFKNFDIKSWVQFAEVYGQPIRLGKYDGNATEDQKRKLMAAVFNIAQDAAAIIPKSMELEFIESKITGNLQLFEKFAEYLDRQVSKAVLGQTGTTDAGQHVGTANAHEEVRGDIETSDAVQLAATLNRDLVRPIIDLNFGPRQAYPCIKIGRPKPEDINTLCDNITKLVPLGLRVERSWIADKLGIPDPDAGAELLSASGTAGDSPGEPAAPPARAAHAASQPGQAQTDALDDLAAEALSDWQPLIAPALEPVQELLAECQSLEEFLAKLPGLAAKQDPSALGEHLARAMFAAKLVGLAGLDMGQGGKHGG